MELELELESGLELELELESEQELGFELLLGLERCVRSGHFAEGADSASTWGHRELLEGAASNETYKFGRFRSRALIGEVTIGNESKFLFPNFGHFLKTETAQGRNENETTKSTHLRFADASAMVKIESQC